MNKQLFIEVRPGVVLSRVQDLFSESLKKYPVITLQELSYRSGESIDMDFDKTVDLPKDNEDKYALVENGNLVFALTSRKAMVIEGKEEKAILPTNFVHLVFDTTLYDHYFLMWLFNENKVFQNVLNSYIQGSALKMIPVKALREIAFKTPPLNTQQMIGKIYKQELQYEKKVIKHKETVMNYLNGLYNKKRGNETW